MNKRDENKFLPKDKKAFEMIWNTVIIIILGLVFLTTIILFFTGTAEGFFDTIQSYFSKTNVDSVVEGCNLRVEGNQEYSFCCEKKSVKYYFQGEPTKGEFSCDELVDKEFIAGKIDSLDCSGRVC